MPTDDDVYELMDYTNLTHVTMEGVPGVKMTSIVNGKSIFVPSTGWIEGTTKYLEDEDSDIGAVYFWTSRCSDWCVSEANTFLLSYDECRIDYSSQNIYHGRNIRGVTI